MSNGSKYKIYFPINTSNSWLGGVNYFKNLFMSLSMVNDGSLEIYIPEDNPEILLKYAKGIKIPKKDFKYRFYKIISALFGKKLDMQKYIYQQLPKFDIVSHTYDFAGIYPEISWIFDFQHKKLPQFFSEEDLHGRDILFQTCAQKSAAVILSSNDAKNDFEYYYPKYAHKAKVLNFVSYISPDIYENTDKIKNNIKQKYSLPEKYFYLPNQFWQHKNHITVLKAVNELKKRGIDVNVVCSGNIEDIRNKDYYNNVILKYIKENQLENNIYILGIIELNEVYYLMRNSISVINPSLFEGWSSTVEEVKSLGKNIILSDLNVHKEQNPPGAKFFQRENYIELADIMEHNWNNMQVGPDFELEEIARKTMNQRMQAFGQKYLEIVKNI